MLPNLGPIRRLAACAAAACLLATSAAAAPTSPFVAAVAGVFDGPGNPVVPELLQSSATGPLLVDAGTLPSAYIQFRSSFGSNGFAGQTQGGIDREVDGGSIWTDGFTITGGSGTGIATLGTHLQGTLAGASMTAYALYVSSQPFDLQVIIATVGAAPGFWAVQLPGATRVPYTGAANGCGQPHPMGDCGHVPYENWQGPLDVTMSAGVPFTYGQTFYVASLLAGGVGIDGGSASFMNSADFGITAPAGAALQALSGTAYVNAVPEPPAALLLAAGALLVLVTRQRTRRPV